MRAFDESMAALGSDSGMYQKSFTDGRKEVIVGLRAPKRHRIVETGVAAASCTRKTGAEPTATEDIREFIQSIAKALVDDPGAVEVAIIQGHHCVIFELKVAKSDLGKIIGRSGRTADAIRTLLAGVSSKNSMKVLLEIIE